MTAKKPASPAQLMLSAARHFSGRGMLMNSSSEKN